MRRRAVSSALLLCLALSVACASAPPNLSPAGQQAFINTRVIKALDLVRDTAIAANAQTPPILSTATTRKIVTYHESTIKIIHATSSGWQTAVETSLDELQANLSAAEKTLLAPYIALVKSLIVGVAG